jgi:hypothetical protein
MTPTATTDPTVPPGGTPPTGTTPPAGTAMPTQPAGGLTTYHHDIRPIIEARCTGCHVDGGVGPFVLDTWESVKATQLAIIPAVTSHRMPPWPADDTNCLKHANKQRLTDEQVGLFMKWQADGFQEGVPTEFAPLVEEDAVIEVGEPDLIVTPRAHQLQRNFEGYICSQTDANFAEDVWVRALDVKPEHSKFVHHAIVNVGGGTCDALGVSAENIYSYRPGSRTVVFQEGDAMKIAAGSRIAIQFHYNTRGVAPQDSYPTDSSPLRLWTLPKGQMPMRQIHRQPVHSFSITIPVGAVDQSVRTTQALEARAPAEVIGISPHMHLLGQRFKSTLSGGGTDACLAEINDWQEGWQIDYLFKPSEYVKAAAGMSISQECVYSNRPEDQGIGPDGKQYTPQLTTFGEDTRNEMCLGYVWYRQPLGGFQ